MTEGSHPKKLCDEKDGKVEGRSRFTYDAKFCEGDLIKETGPALGRVHSIFNNALVIETEGMEKDAPRLFPMVTVVHESRGKGPGFILLSDETGDFRKLKPQVDDRALINREKIEITCRSDRKACMVICFGKSEKFSSIMPPPDKDEEEKKEDTKEEKTEVKKEEPEPIPAPPPEPEPSEKTVDESKKKPLKPLKIDIIREKKVKKEEIETGAINLNKFPDLIPTVMKKRKAADSDLGTINVSLHPDLLEQAYELSLLEEPESGAINFHNISELVLGEEVFEDDDFDDEESENGTINVSGYVEKPEVLPGEDFMILHDVHDYETGEFDLKFDLLEKKETPGDKDTKETEGRPSESLRQFFSKVEGLNKHKLGMTFIRDTEKDPFLVLNPRRSLFLTGMFGNRLPMMEIEEEIIQSKDLTPNEKLEENADFLRSYLFSDHKPDASSLVGIFNSSDELMEFAGLKSDVPHNMDPSEAPAAQYIAGIIQGFLRACDEFSDENSRLKKRFKRKLKSIIGLGPGLTPSCDDMLLGIITAGDYMKRVIFNPEPPGMKKFLKVHKEIRDTLPGLLDNTGFVSKSYLWYALNYRCTESLQNFMKTFTDGSLEKNPDAAKNLEEHGASSGRDIMCGILTAQIFAWKGKPG